MGFWNMEKNAVKSSFLTNGSHVLHCNAIDYLEYIISFYSLFQYLVETNVYWISQIRVQYKYSTIKGSHA